jgi:hypothetical protein
MLARTILACVALAAIANAIPETMQSQAVPTKVMVRVTAHDAKIIGTGVGDGSSTGRRHPAGVDWRHETHHDRAARA